MVENGDKTLRVERDGYIATLILSRPEKRNALAPGQLITLHRTLKKFEENDDVRCVIFRGDGDTAFSSGYDITAIPTKVPPEVQESLKEHNPLDLALDAVRNFQYPTIAMINGYAFGAGFNLCACCDIRIAADDVKMGMPPAKLGLIYHPAGLQQFIEAYGISTVKDIFFSARTYSGPDLLSRGIVDYLIRRSDLEKFTVDYARQITKNAPLSLKGMKKIINMFGNDMALSDTASEAAMELIRISFESDDLKEGQTAFIEKRKPKFTGK